MTRHYQSIDPGLASADLWKRSAQSRLNERIQIPTLRRKNAGYMNPAKPARPPSELFLTSTVYDNTFGQEVPSGSRILSPLESEVLDRSRLHNNRLIASLKSNNLRLQEDNECLMREVKRLFAHIQSLDDDNNSDDYFGRNSTVTGMSETSMKPCQIGDPALPGNGVNMTRESHTVVNSLSYPYRPATLVPHKEQTQTGQRALDDDDNYGSESCGDDPATVLEAFNRRPKLIPDLQEYLRDIKSMFIYSGFESEKQLQNKFEALKGVCAKARDMFDNSRSEIIFLGPVQIINLDDGDPPAVTGHGHLLDNEDLKSWEESDLEDQINLDLLESRGRTIERLPLGRHHQRLQ